MSYKWLTCLYRSYTNNFVELEFKTGPCLAIHRTVLGRGSKLARLCDASAKSIRLWKVSHHAGHAMVHYLYTGKLDLLDEWMGPETDSEFARLKTLFRVYAVARTYELEGLEDLAKAEIEQFTGTTDPFVLIDVVKEAYPTPIGDDPWFQGYIKSRIKAAFRDPTALLSTECLPNFGDGASVVKIVLGCMLEVYADLLASLGGEGGRLLTRGVDDFEQIARDPVLEDAEDGNSAVALSVSEIREYFDTLLGRSRGGTPERQLEAAEPDLSERAVGLKPEPELEQMVEATLKEPKPVMEPVLESVYFPAETPPLENAAEPKQSKKKKAKVSTAVFAS